jgi:hypothetical protein
VGTIIPLQSNIIMAQNPLTLAQVADRQLWSIRTLCGLLTRHGLATIGSGRLTRLSPEEVEDLERKERERCRTRLSASAVPFTSPANVGPIDGPRRIQLRWRLPPGAINCARPSPYGNRYVIGRNIEHVDGERILVRDRAHAVALIRLGGGDVVCWGALDQPCYVDVYLKVANR